MVALIVLLENLPHVTLPCSQGIELQHHWQELFELQHSGDPLHDEVAQPRRPLSRDHALEVNELLIKQLHQDRHQDVVLALKMPIQAALAQTSRAR